MRKQILSIFIFLTISGCSPLYYVPNSQNVPMIKEKGQTNLSGSVGWSGYTNSFEFQGAYGLTDKIALQLNGFSGTSKKQDGDCFKGSGTMLEVGAGYYKKISPMFVFETYGLVNFGTTESKLWGENFGPDAGNVKADFLRIGLQPSISFSQKHIAAAISSRIANLSYKNIGGTFFPEVDYLKSNNSFWLWEPGVTLQVGFENVKLQLQYVYSFNLTDPNFAQDVDHISLGLILNIHPHK